MFYFFNCCKKRRAEEERKSLEVEIREDKCKKFFISFCRIMEFISSYEFITGNGLGALEVARETEMERRVRSV